MTFLSFARISLSLKPDTVYCRYASLSSTLLTISATDMCARFLIRSIYRTGYLLDNLQFTFPSLLITYPTNFCTRLWTDRKCLFVNLSEDICIISKVFFAVGNIKARFSLIFRIPWSFHIRMILIEDPFAIPMFLFFSYSRAPCLLCGPLNRY